MLVLCEMFQTIQGEGPYQGYVTSFIRFQGCNLRCKWCDTKRAQREDLGPLTPIPKVLEKLKMWNTKKLCITGGEPLLQLEGLNQLLKSLPPSLSVSIETNGTLPISKVVRPRHLKELVFVVDVKGPSSGEEGKFDLSNLLPSRSGEVALKFVVLDATDASFVENFLLTYAPYNIPIFVSPVMPKEEFPLSFQTSINLVMELERKYEFDIRLQVQLHKVLGVE